MHTPLPRLYSCLKSSKSAIYGTQKKCARFWMINLIFTQILWNILVEYSINLSSEIYLKVLSSMKQIIRSFYCYSQKIRHNTYIETLNVLQNKTNGSRHNWATVEQRFTKNIKYDIIIQYLAQIVLFDDQWLPRHSVKGTNW